MLISCSRPYVHPHYIKYYPFNLISFIACLLLRVEVGYSRIDIDFTREDFRPPTVVGTISLVGLTFQLFPVYSEVPIFNRPKSSQVKRKSISQLIYAHNRKQAKNEKILDGLYLMRRSSSRQWIYVRACTGICTVQPSYLPAKRKSYLTVFCLLFVTLPKDH